MKKPNQLISILLIAASTYFLSGCAATGFHASTNSTQVQLNSGNYRVIAKSVKGEAQARYLFGASFGYGIYNQTMALIPLDKQRNLYSMAMDDLWKNFEEKHGSPEGKRVALANIRYDAQAVNLFFYTRPQLIIVADVIAFDD